MADDVVVIGESLDDGARGRHRGSGRHRAVRAAAVTVSRPGADPPYASDLP